MNPKIDREGTSLRGTAVSTNSDNDGYQTGKGCLLLSGVLLVLLALVVVLALVFIPPSSSGVG